MFDKEAFQRPNYNNEDDFIIYQIRDVIMPNVLKLSWRCNVNFNISNIF